MQRGGWLLRVPEAVSGSAEPVPVQAPPAEGAAAAGAGAAGAEEAAGRAGRPEAPGGHQQAHQEATHQALYELRQALIYFRLNH